MCRRHGFGYCLRQADGQCPSLRRRKGIAAAEREGAETLPYILSESRCAEILRLCGRDEPCSSAFLLPQAAIGWTIPQSASQTAPFAQRSLWGGANSYTCAKKDKPGATVRSHRVLVMFVSAAEVGAADTVIVHQLVCIAAHGDAARFQNVGAVCDGERHLRVLLHEEDGDAALMQR